MKASIVIPTKDKMSRLKLTLKALENQIDKDIEVVIVFDGCNAETLQSFNDLKLPFNTVNVISKNCVGRAAARNLGIQKSKGDIIIFLDDDRIPSDTFVEKHINGHINTEECVLLGRRNEVYLGEKYIEGLYSDNFEKEFKRYTASVKPYPFYSLKAFFLFGTKNPLRYIIFSTGNISLNRSIIDRIGIFDENFKGWGHEDAELGYRIAKEGIRFFLDNSIENFHLTHTINKENKRNEGLRNIRYFSKKYKKDLILRFLLGIREILLLIGV